MSTAAPAWECQRSVEADVPVWFAWQYMTDIRNWNEPSAEFTLDGPFAPGTRGTTHMPGEPPRDWIIGGVEPGRGHTIESGSSLENATLLVHWRFDPVSERTARLTQRIELWGENADAYVEGMRAGFEPNLEPGMRRIATLMEQRHNTKQTP